jgi:DNA-binding MarR family transcriptional regulator
MAKPATSSPSTRPEHPSSFEAVQALARVTRVLERATADLSLAHYRVLSAIALGDERGSRVAARLALGKPAVSAAVDSLCQRGLLARSSVDEDRRAATLRVTVEGEMLLASVETEMVRRLDDLCTRTPDRARVIESLVWLGVAMDQARAERVAP